MRRTGFVSTVVAAVVVTACAGCGSNSGSGGAAGGGTISGSGGAVNTAAPLHAALPADVAKKGKLVFGAFLQQPPDVFLDADGVTPIGFEAELSQAVADKLGVPREYQNMQFDALITSLQANRIDLTMSAMNDKKEREDKIDFVDYFRGGIALMVAKGNPKGVNSPADICGHSVGVVTNTTQSDFAAKSDATCKSAGKAAVSAVVTNSDAQNQLSLKTGRIDIIINDLPTAAYLAKTSGEGKDFEVVPGDPIDPGPYGIGVNKSNTQLRDAVQKAVQATIDDGSYTKILTKWGVQSGAVTKATVNAAP